MNESEKNKLIYELIGCDVENIGEMIDGIKADNDNELLEKLYGEIISKSKYTRSFRSVGDSICKHLEDTGWVRMIYTQGILKAKSSYDCIEIAESYIKYLDDKNSAEELCKKANQLAEHLGQVSQTQKF